MIQPLYQSWCIVYVTNEHELTIEVFIPGVIQPVITRTWPRYMPLSKFLVFRAIFTPEACCKEELLDPKACWINYESQAAVRRPINKWVKAELSVGCCVEKGPDVVIRAPSSRRLPWETGQITRFLTLASSRVQKRRPTRPFWCLILIVELNKIRKMYEKR